MSAFEEWRSKFVRSWGRPPTGMEIWIEAHVLGQQAARADTTLTERERCAKVAEGFHADEPCHGQCVGECRVIGAQIAAAIREDA